MHAIKSKTRRLNYSEMEEKRMDANFRKRLRRRLYHGNVGDLDTPSFPLTDMAVSYFRDTVPEKLGFIDHLTASNIIRHNHVSPCSVVLSMLYAKRLQQQSQRSKEFLQTMSSSDVFFISMMMASKYLYDEGVEEEVFNDEWADNTDQDVDDVNQMEVDFLQALDWKLFVRPHEFEETLYAIEKRLALQEGLKRGWFTYSELDVLMDMDLVRTVWTQVGSECSKLVTVLSAGYLTSLLSMLASTALAIHISGPLSSATVTLLSLQSSPLLASMSGLSSVDVMALSTAWSSSGLPPGVESENNHSEPEEAFTILNRHPDWMTKRSFAGLEKPKQISGTFSKEENRAGNFGSDDDDKEDGSIGKETNGNQCGRAVKSSLWSLWFLDSFLAQLWAVTSKSKISHYVGWSVTKPTPRSFSNDCRDEKTSCLPRQQNYQNPTFPCRRKMSSSSPKSSPTERFSLDVCNTQDVSNDVTSEEHSCSYHVADLPEIRHLRQIWPWNWDVDRHCSHHCETTPKSWSQHMSNSHTSQLCHGHSSCLPEHSEKHVSCHCCCGHEIPALGHDPDCQSSNHNPPQHGPVKNIPKSVVLLPSLYSTPELLKVPVGFVTSFFQAAQVL